jgi:carbon monoxide dehydrogenase subunit G
MELAGETLIAAPRQRVWDALNDPDVLARCIDGVEKLERVGDNRFEGTMNARVGPVRARFAGGVELVDLDPPQSYRLVGEGKGGVAGFAKGEARVTLADAGDGTRLHYEVTSAVGGKLAQLGARLIEGAARGYAEAFFNTFKGIVEVGSTPPVAEAAPTAAATPRTEPVASGLSPVVWGGLVIAAVSALLLVLLG